MIVETAELIKDHLIENTDLDQIQIAVQIDQQNGRDRAVNDAAPADLAQIRVEVDAVLLIQSANVMSEPRSLARLYAAMKSGVPIIPAVIKFSRIYFAHSAAKTYREFTRILRISWNTGMNRPFEVAISLIDFTPGPLWSCL